MLLLNLFFYGFLFCVFCLIIKRAVQLAFRIINSLFDKVNDML